MSFSQDIESFVNVVTRMFAKIVKPRQKSNIIIKTKMNGTQYNKGALILGL